jgi:D-lactate dehydrogenase
MLISHFQINSWQQEFLGSKLTEYQNLFFEVGDILSHLDQIKDCEVLSVFIQTKVSREVIDSLPNLKLIVTRSTGFDHIDVVYAKRKGISVSNVPSYGSVTVAEHAFALIFALAKNLTTLQKRTSALDFTFQDRLGFDLENKTLGVIGAGKIGLHAISLAKALNMKVIAHDVYQNEEARARLGFEYVGIDELLSQSQIISLHTPLNDYTKNLLNRENLNKVTPGTTFINTARGSLIRNDDLLWALETGVFGAVGLDTLDGEEKMFAGQVDEIQKQILINPNVIYTPHSAFYTKEAVSRILTTSAENILNYIHTTKLTNLV